MESKSHTADHQIEYEYRAHTAADMKKKADFSCGDKRSCPTAASMKHSEFMVLRLNCLIEGIELLRLSSFCLAQQL